MKHPYRDVMRDQRSKVIEDPRNECCDFDDMMRDRSRGVNAEPDEGFRDGVKSVKRMHPDHYIPNSRG